MYATAGQGERHGTSQAQGAQAASKEAQEMTKERAVEKPVERTIERSVESNKGTIPGVQIEEDFRVRTTGSFSTLRVRVGGVFEDLRVHTTP